MSNYAKGLEYEYKTISLLQSQGHCLVKHRLRNTCGEIDLLTCHQSCMYITEVKYRPDISTALESVLGTPVDKLYNTYLYWLQLHPGYISCDLVMQYCVWFGVDQYRIGRYSE